MCLKPCGTTLTNRRKEQMNKTEMINVIAIICLAIVVSLTLLTNFRICEVLENGQVLKVPCVEVHNYEN